MATQAVTEKPSERKRSIAEVDNNNDESRKRGRPRLDPQSESAADRRRTQIRIAQRAYRQRKESTIDDLRKQVEDLQATIQDMNQSFQQLSETCLTGNTPPHLVASLRNVANQYSKLTGSVNMTDFNVSSPSSGGDNGYKTVTAIPEIQHTKPNTRIALSQIVPEQHNWNSVTSTVPEAQTQYKPNHHGMSHSTNQPREDQYQYFNVSENIMMRSSIPKTLDIPFTYSFQEKSFARRLHRESCEFAYRLACNPTMLPQGFNSVFKLTLKVAGAIGRVKKSLETTLKKSVHEPLSNWGATFVFVGGAGTHYPRPIEEGGWVHRTQGPWAETNVGPHKLFGSNPEEAMTAEMLLRRTNGMEGEWFDAYDVEGYLMEKGIHLDPMCSYAEIELPEPEQSSAESSPSASSMVATATYGAPIDTSAYYSMQPPALEHNMGYAHLEGNHMVGVPYAPTTPTAYAPPSTPPHLAHKPISRNDSGYADSLAGQQYMANMPFTYQIQMPRKTKATIDVAEFIKIMSMHGTCLMRAPGYRRSTIDEALRKSMVRSY